MQKEIIIGTTKEIMGTTMMTVRDLLLSFPAKPEICLHKKIGQMYVKVSNGYMERVTKLKLVSKLENL